MPDLDVNRVGLIGIIKDQHDLTLDPGAWSDGRNIRFRHSSVRRIGGDQVVFDGASVTPYWCLPTTTQDTRYLLYGSLTALASWNGSSHVTRTRTTGGAYSANEETLWNGGVLNGIPVVNNGNDVPQFWATIGTGTLENLTNWPSTHRCKVIVPFKNFLIALNLTISAVEKPHRVLWSHSADPGTIPSSWDVTDATKDAGELDLADVNSGVIEGALQLGNQLIIYKTNAVYSLRFVGGQYIFSPEQIFSTFGAINSRSFAEVPRATTAKASSRPRQHLVATGNDLILHDGQSASSVLDKRLQEYLAATIDSTYYRRSFIVANQREDEMWFCYPTGGSPTCTEALIWNYEDNTLTLRDLSNFTHGIETYIEESTISNNWDSDSQAWDADTTIWNEGSFSALQRGVVMCQPGNTDFLQVDVTSQFNGVSFTSFVERTGLPFGYDRFGQPQVDLNSRKLMLRVWPKMDGAACTIKAIVQEEPEGVTTYSAGVVFTPQSGQKWVDFNPPLAGRVTGLRFEFDTDAACELHGYKLDMAKLGEF